MQNYLYDSSSGLSKEPVIQIKNLHHNDMFQCMMPRTESRTSPNFLGVCIYISNDSKIPTVLGEKICI